MIYNIDVKRREQGKKEGKDNLLASKKGKSSDPQRKYIIFSTETTSTLHF